MSTSQEDIKRWFVDGVTKGASHMIVVCDTFDWDDYPVYVMPGSDPRITWNANNGPNMTKAMECYALWKPIDPQLAQHRVCDFEIPGAPKQ